MSFLRPTGSVSGWLRRVSEPLRLSLENTRLRTDAPTLHIAARVSQSVLPQGGQQHAAPTPPRGSVLDILPAVSNLVVVEKCNSNGESVCSLDFINKAM